MGKSGCALDWRLGIAGSGGKWPVGGRETVGGQRSRAEGEEEVDLSGLAGPVQLVGQSLLGSRSSG